MDEEIARTTMPEEYRDKYVDIHCRDCQAVISTPTVQSHMCSMQAHSHMHISVLVHLTCMHTLTLNVRSHYQHFFNGRWIVNETCFCPVDFCWKKKKCNENLTTSVHMFIDLTYYFVSDFQCAVACSWHEVHKLWLIQYLWIRRQLAGDVILRSTPLCRFVLFGCHDRRLKTTMHDKFTLFTSINRCPPTVDCT